VRVRRFAGVLLPVLLAIFLADVLRAEGSATYRNPVIRQNFPDPSVLRVGGVYYAYGTNSDTMNIVTATSRDLVHWSAVNEALPQPGTWADQSPPSPTRNQVWAPEVMATAQGDYAMFYVAREATSQDECIGVARAANPSGPFADSRQEPLLCQRRLGGSIDPSPFRAPDGSLHLLWKNAGNHNHSPDHLWTQPLTPRLRLVGKRTILLSITRAWEHNTVEGPEMVVHGGVFWLFFAANEYHRRSYVEAVARCRTRHGPCVAGKQPLLRADSAASGPGHGFVVTTPSRQTWLLYHAWLPGHIGPYDPGRQLWLSRLRWTKSGPAVTQPTTRQQAAPIS
jgi:beta-xylosidase